MSHSLTCSASSSSTFLCPPGSFPHTASGRTHSLSRPYIFRQSFPFPAVRHHKSSHARCASGGYQKKLLHQQRQKRKAKTETGLCGGCGAPHEGTLVFEHHHYVSNDLKALFLQATHQRWCLRWRFAGHVLLGAGAWDNPRGAHQRRGAHWCSIRALNFSGRISEGERTEQQLRCFSSHGNR